MTAPEPDQIAGVGMVLHATGAVVVGCVLNHLHRNLVVPLTVLLDETSPSLGVLVIDGLTVTVRYS